MTITHTEILEIITEEHLTAREAAERFGKTVSHIHYLCAKHAVIPEPGRVPVFPDIANPDWLKQKLVDEDLSCREIAEMVGCSRQHVYQKAKEFDLPRKKIRIPKRQRKHRPFVPLKGILSDKRLRGTYKKQLHIAHVGPSGKIQVRQTRELFVTPDEAAQAVCEKKTRGMAFWHYKVAPGTWAPLSTLADRIAQKRKEYDEKEAKYKRPSS